MKKPKVELTPLFIDKLAFTVGVRADNKQLFRNARAVIEGLGNKAHAASRYKKGQRYRHNFEVSLKGESTALIQFDPLQKTNGSFRFEFNPRNGSTKTLKRFEKLLQRIFGVHAPELKHAKITRIDLAVDIRGVCMHDLLIYRDKVKKGSTWHGKNGELETLVLGVPQSSRQVKLYNKAQEISDTTGAKVEGSLVRLEYSIAPRIKAVDLLKLENPFEGLSIISVAGATRGSGMWNLFIDSCRLKPMASALAQINKRTTRDKFRLRLCNECAVDWWDEKQVWRGFRAAVRELRIFGI